MVYLSMPGAAETTRHSSVSGSPDSPPRTLHPVAGGDIHVGGSGSNTERRNTSAPPQATGRPPGTAKPSVACTCRSGVLREAPAASGKMWCWLPASLPGRGGRGLPWQASQAAISNVAPTADAQPVRDSRAAPRSVWRSTGRKLGSRRRRCETPLPSIARKVVGPGRGPGRGRGRCRPYRGGSRHGRLPGPSCLPTPGANPLQDTSDTPARGRPPPGRCLRPVQNRPARGLR
jgi:hypothetical protein